MDPRRLVPIAVLLLAGCSRPSVPSILLLTLDTTVPEALGCYGNTLGLTPNLDRLASEGIVFEDARAVAPLTLPAHASMLTGLYPPRHGLRRNGETRLAPEASTLAERAGAHGYRTAAFVAAVVLAPEFGLDQGFERYDAPATPEDVEEHLEASRPAAEVAAGALAWLSCVEHEPFFLWLHFYDPHFPHDPTPEALELAHGDPYLAEVAQMDAAIGTVLAELERTGRLDQTVVVVVADHGEGRGRHGEETHGAFVFDSTLRIPFLARLPGGRRAGERVEGPVSQVDILPLLAHELGWDLPELPDGHDPLAAPSAEGVYFESYFGTKSFGWSPLAGWTDGHTKYVHSSAPQLFDLRQDPGETQDLLSEERAAPFRARILELCARPRLARTLLAEDGGDLRREIERLGYAGAGEAAEEPDPEPLEAGDRPSPHRMVDAYAAYMQGRKVYEEHGPREEAIQWLQRALATNPENHKAWFTLGLAQLDLQLFEPAAEAFRRALASPGGERIPARLNLAVCLYGLGRRDEALTELEQALAQTDGPPGALELLVRLLEESGRASEAARARARIGSRAGARAEGASAEG